MSSNKARDYVESYVAQGDDYLTTEQPLYDANKPMSQPQTAPLEKDPQPEPAPASDHYKLHLPTQNPIPSDTTTPTSNTDTTDTTDTEPKAKVEWAVRDFKDQRNEIHETSLTICADLHQDLFTCFKDGSWWDKAKMCEEQKQTFWKCYNTQKRFLKDVNYKGPVTSHEEDRRILLEAYKLRDKQDKEAAAAK